MDAIGSSTLRRPESRSYETPDYLGAPRAYIWPGLEVHNVPNRREGEHRIAEEVSRSDERGLGQALDILGGDGLSSTTHQHMMDRFHQERNSERGPAPGFSDLWNEHFASPITRRRRDRNNLPSRSEATAGASPNPQSFADVLRNTSRRSTSSSPTRDPERVTLRAERGPRIRRFRFQDSPSVFGESPRIDVGYGMPFRRRARNFGDYVVRAQSLLWNVYELHYI
jgi:hypothetical protein